MRFSTIVAAISAIASVVYAAPTDAPTGTQIDLRRPASKTTSSVAAEGTHISPAIWWGQLAVGGPVVNITADSFAEVFDYVGKHIDPAIQAEHDAQIANLTNTAPAHIAQDQSTCWGGPYFKERAFGEAYRYLTKQTGWCAVKSVDPVGWVLCSRVSCSHDSGAFICTSSEGMALPCATIGHGLKDVHDLCGGFDFAGIKSYSGLPVWNEYRGVLKNGPDYERGC